MDGVSAVRAYTLIAVLALLAGGWMLNEAPTQEIEDDKQLLFGDTDALPASTEEHG